MLLECSKEIRWLINYPRFHCFRVTLSCNSIIRGKYNNNDLLKFALKSPLIAIYTLTLKNRLERDNRITVHRKCNTNFAKRERIINRALLLVELSCCCCRTARFTFCPVAGAARTLNIRAVGRTGRTSTWSGWAVRVVAAVCVVRSSYFPAP